MTIVCGDSHTATHGAFGRWRSASDERDRDGTRHADAASAQAEDLQGRSERTAPAGRRRQGHHPRADRQDRIGGGTGHVIDYTGDAIRALSMEERMTVCNMSIEGGARAGLIAPTRPPSPTLRVASSLRGVRPGTRRSPAGASFRATQARPTTGRSSSTATSSSRWSPTARNPEWACR